MKPKTKMKKILPISNWEPNVSLEQYRQWDNKSKWGSAKKRARTTTKVREPKCENKWARTR